ncbi:MAG: 3-dehydroquinate synthase [Lachnospiraceae bacterium]|nr:3-dehydroquinate synthase [Lachnospiraceae bacterium]
MYINVESTESGYEITHQRGALKRVGEIVNLNRKVCIVTDDGVPAEYAKTVADQCKEAFIITLPQGEPSKNIDNFLLILREMLSHSFTRNDLCIAVGGGVCGDMTAFAASCYMRGIDFVNIPTTVLSMVDSSIGGKTAIDFEGVKNVVGSFFMPKAVIIDFDVLKTLSNRQISAGLTEAIKMAATFDEELFSFIEESTSLNDDIEKIIEGSNAIKKKVVEEDPKEKGLRKVLNFGHTVGHAIESKNEGRILHGECVALGMTIMCSEQVKKRLIPILKKYNLPTEIQDDMASLGEIMKHDKKAKAGKITTVYCPEIGSYEFRDMTIEELISLK